MNKESVSIFLDYQNKTLIITFLAPLRNMNFKLMENVTPFDEEVEKESGGDRRADGVD
ncbi:MAG TPA: hypothetical protein PK765_02070 [bacterium]|nr:hypothetical protein [bacterium]